MRGAEPVTAIPAGDPLATAVVGALHAGDLDALGRLLGAHPGLATATIASPCGTGDPPAHEHRTLLHVATDWPGHRPRVAEAIATLARAGADPDAPFTTTPPSRSHAETPLHWAASSDDTDAVDALLDAGAAIDAPGAVIAGGTPLDDAVAFAQWRAAHRLVARGARTELWHAAALGLLDRVEAHLAAPAPARHPWGVGDAGAPDPRTVALWCACHGGRRAAAELLLAHGAELDWASPWDGLTPLDAARRQGAADVVRWLESRGASSADDPDP